MEEREKGIDRMAIDIERRNGRRRLVKARGERGMGEREKGKDRTEIEIEGMGERKMECRGNERTEDKNQQETREV